MKIVALIENTGETSLCCEHGLSVYIEYQNKKYLLDAGATDSFLENAKKFKIDLSNVNTAFLSHAHYDHSGGFEGFFQINQSAVVYLQEKGKEHCYSIRDGRERYIGLPDGLLQKYEDRFYFLTGDRKIDEGVWLITHKTEHLEERGVRSDMYRGAKGNYYPDDFSHEQSLVFDTAEGLVIFNSCSHGGICNIVRDVADAFNGKKVYAVIGGFHLKGREGICSMSCTEQEVQEIGEKLLDLGVEEIYTGHCTGEPAFEILKKTCKEHLHHLQTGTVIEFKEF